MQDPIETLLLHLLLTAVVVERHERLPPMPITPEALAALPEYSTTIPTGTGWGTMSDTGKRWRRNAMVTVQRWVGQRCEPLWQVVQYEPGATPDEALVVPYRPVRPSHIDHLRS